MFRRGGDERTGGELSAWEKARVVQAVMECRLFGYGADWESCDDHHDGARGVLVEVRASMDVVDLGMSLEGLEASRFTSGARVEVRALLLDGFRAVSQWKDGETQVQFRVVVMTNRENEQALKSSNSFLIVKGLEDVLNGEFCRMARLKAEGVASSWREAFLRKNGFDDEDRTHESIDFVQSGNVALFEMDDGEADEVETEREILALLALRWVQRGLLGCLANCVAC